MNVAELVKENRSLSSKLRYYESVLYCPPMRLELESGDIVNPICSERVESIMFERDKFKGLAEAFALEILQTEGHVGIGRMMVFAHQVFGIEDV
jgi:hypothetical protein